jgi:hypothetical protein
VAECNEQTKRAVPVLCVVVSDKRGRKPKNAALLSLSFHLLPSGKGYLATSTFTLFC